MASCVGCERPFPPLYCYRTRTEDQRNYPGVRFDITPASEIMAILCLAKDEKDLRRRIENILLGFTYDNKPFTVKDLGVAGAITVLLKDALSPNLVQTTEHTAAFVHGDRLPISLTVATLFWQPRWQ